MNLTDSDNLKIRKVLQESVSNSANVLNEMLQSNIEMSVPNIFSLFLSPHVNEILKNELEEGDLTSISLQFQGNIQGEAKLILTTESAYNLVNYLTGMNSEADEYEMYVQETLNEIGNIVLNSICGTISNLINEHIEYSVPNVSQGNFDKILFKNFKDPHKIVFMGKTNFEIRELSVFGMMTILLQEYSVKSILSSIE